MDLFVYGTLLFPEVVAALLDRVPVRAPATVTGWRAAALPGRVYPGLVPAPHRMTDGSVLEGLSHRESRLIDAYEGRGYQLTVVGLCDGRPRPTYVWTAAALDQDWNAAAFARDHLSAYVQRCRRWRAAMTGQPAPER